jgi:RWD domain
MPQPEVDGTLLEEELCAIEAIFGDDCVVDQPERRVQVWVPSKDAVPRFQLMLSFPDGYPSRECPVIELLAPQLSPDVHANLVQQLEDIHLPGEVRI